MTIFRCRFCKNDSCGDCELTEHGTITILWNGHLAMEADYLICKHCSGGWLETSGGKLFLCASCRKRAMRVEIRGAEDSLLSETVRAIARGAA